MKNYEVYYIISPKLDEAAREDIITKFADVVKTAGGEANVTKKEFKKLAYEIDFVKEGQYVLMEFSAPETVPAEIERQMRITDGILRFMVTRKIENKLTRKEAVKRAEIAKRNEAREAAKAAQEAKAAEVKGEEVVEEAAAEEVKADETKE